MLIFAFTRLKTAGTIHATSALRQRVPQPCSSHQSSTAPDPADMPCKPAAVRRCADLTSCVATPASSAGTARATTSTAPSSAWTRSSATTAHERSQQHDAPAVRLCRARHPARRCSRVSPSRERHPSQPQHGSTTTARRRAKSQHRPLVSRTLATRVRVFEQQGALTGSVSLSAGLFSPRPRRSRSICADWDGAGKKLSHGMVTPPADAWVAREQVACPVVKRPSSPGSSPGQIIRRACPGAARPAVYHVGVSPACRLLRGIRP